MPNTAKGSRLTGHLRDLLKLPANLETLAPLQARDIYYGDQENIPRSPTICVEPAQVLRELEGVPLRTRNDMTCAIFVYAADVNGVEEAQEAADTYSELVVDIINADGLPVHQGGTAFGDNVMYGFVSASEYGYIVKSGKLFRANRLRVYGRSVTNLLEA